MKKTAQNIIFPLVALLAMNLASCSDEFVKGVYIASNNEYSLNIQSIPLQSIPAEGGVIDSRIQASNAVCWSIQDLPEWMTTTMASGKGPQDIKFNIEPNESYISSRTHIFNIVTDNSDWKIAMPVSVTQLKRDKRLALTPSDNSLWTFDSEGGNKEVSISSNVNWKAECNEDFVSLSKNSGFGDSEMIITVASYKSIDVTSSRKATVCFKEVSDDEVLQVLTITQTPLQTSMTTETITVDFDKAQNSKTFSLGAISGSYSVYSDALWLNISKNKEDEVDVTLTCDANADDEERTTNAYVFFENTNSIKYAFAVKQQGNVLVIDPTSITFNANGGIQTVSVSSSTPWKTTNLYDWISVQENGSSCTVLVKENNTLDTRSGEISFSRLNSYGDVLGRTVKLFVQQDGREISPDAQTIQFGPEASSKTLNIESDVQWSLTTDETWISTSVSEGYGNKAVTVSVLENTSASSRTGILKLTSLGKTIGIIVTQESEYLNTPTSAITLGAIGGRATISLESNVSWSASVSKDWLYINPESGTGRTTINVNAEDNSTTSLRNAVITISSKKRNIKIIVNQKAPNIRVSNSSLTFDYQGGKSDAIIVTSDGDFSVSTSNSWITVDKQSNIIYISASENIEGERTGTVTLKLTQADVTTKITITQKEPPIKYVDLGLPSGTKWCSCNLGATNETGKGNLYTGPESDNYMCPTTAQVDELIRRCTWQITTLNGVEGYQATGPNGNYIFFPKISYGGTVKGMYVWAKYKNNDYYQYFLYYNNYYGASRRECARDNGVKHSIREVR